MRELATLVRDAQSGDAGAFGEVVRRMQDMAYGAAFARLRSEERRVGKEC